MYKPLGNPEDFGPANIVAAVFSLPGSVPTDSQNGFAISQFVVQCSGDVYDRISGSTTCSSHFSAPRPGAGRAAEKEASCICLLNFVIWGPRGRNIPRRPFLEETVLSPSRTSCLCSFACRDRDVTCKCCPFTAGQFGKFMDTVQRHPEREKFIFQLMRQSMCKDAVLKK